MAKPAYDRILDLAIGFWKARVLLSAVDLGVFTALAAGPLDAAALRRRIGVHERSARDFFDALVAEDLLERDSAGRYRNGPEAAHFLDPAQPTYIGGALAMFSTRLYGFWGSLTDGLRSGEPQNEAKSGGDLFANIYADPAVLEGFLHAMTGFSLPVAEALAHAFPWREVTSVADIGSAEGCLPVQLALAHPHLGAAGFDLPAVGPLFERYVANHRLSERVRFVAGDFFKDALPQADVLVMGMILHDWDLPTKRMLIGKAHAALPAGGSLIACEMLIDDERRRHLPGLLMSLNMLIETRGGFDFTAADCAGWMREAGFSATRTIRLTGAYSAIVGTK
ncbi:MAG TPA: methyltransferase [Stellaceae bacterium]|nr:methyltransferase [Stellaceae bacterium]